MPPKTFKYCDQNVCLILNFVCSSVWTLLESIFQLKWKILIPSVILTFFSLRHSCRCTRHKRIRKYFSIFLWCLIFYLTEMVYVSAHVHKYLICRHIHIIDTILCTMGDWKISLENLSNIFIIHLQRQLLKAKHLSSRAKYFLENAKPSLDT